jgi:4-amino-4-deoxy-L-arabinose transferase-like glycosyltransferase
MMDVPMALGLTVAAWGVGQATEEERPSALLWAGLGTGVACMLKGPVAVVIALLAFGGFLVLRAPKLILSRWTAGAFLLGAIIGAPWFIASLIVHGQSYLQGFFITENLSRFGKGWALSREMLLVGGFLVFALPWTLLAAGNARVSRRDPGWILPVLWIGATLVTFSLPRDKYPHYGIACLPAAILLAVRAPPPAWACRATGILLALVGLGAGLAIRFPFATAARAALVVGSLSLGAGAVFIGRSQLARGAAAVGLGMSMVAGIALPRMSPELLPRHVRESVGARSLWTYNAQPGGYALIMGRPVRRAFTKEAFVEAISSGAAVIITAQEHEKLPPELRGRAAPLAAWPRFSGSQGIEVLLRSWWSAEIEPLLEPMLVVAALETE